MNISMNMSMSMSMRVGRGVKAKGDQWRVVVTSHNSQISHH